MNSSCILVINCGSSSIKFALISPENGETVFWGLAENLCQPNALFSFQLNAETKQNEQLQQKDHHGAMLHLLEVLARKQLSATIIGVGHRVVHGGETYSQPTLITEQVIQEIDRLSQLAPLHNPANLEGIRSAKAAFSNLPHVAVFDTAFHQSMPDYAYLYGLPMPLYQEHGIRRYGFHGTSHYFMAQQVENFINKPLSTSQIISAHLGNGCSVAAIKHGQSVDTSMGMTPLEGLIMGTRSGDVDPGIIFHLTKQLGYSIDEVNNLLNKESGLLGLSGLSNDCRTLEDAATSGNKQALLALEVFSYRIARYVASLTVGLTQLDALIFTGGIGENSPFIRQKVCQHLSVLNIALAPNKNEPCIRGNSGLINSNNSVPVIVIPTNEEWVIAQKSSTIIQAV